MLNQVVLVGRLKSFEDFGMTLAVPRSYKNENGEYDTDIIPCELSGTIAENTKEYCHHGDIIGVKGHIESQGVALMIKVDKVTFLSSKTDTDTEGGE